MGKYIFSIALAATVCGLTSFPAMAQAPSFGADTLRVARPPQGLQTITLPVEGGEDETIQSEQWFYIWEQYGVRNVVQPSLTVVPAKAGTETGTAVIVIPGGGFNFISWSNEGSSTAEWLAERGITAIILKYRTKTTPRDSAGYADFVKSQIAASRGEGRRFSQPWLPAVADARQAIRYVRRNASKLGVDPNRVGVLGFSAGAITGLQLAIAQEQGDRPSFAALIYGPLAPVNVPASPPPLFLARALNDNLYTPLQSSSLDDNFGLLSRWQAAEGSVELHLYSAGGHGFGMQKNGETSELWVEQFFKWMEARKLLGPVK